MTLTETRRGFRLIMHRTHANEPVETRLIQESSAMGDYEHSVAEPGSSFLWIGDRHHLNREEVVTLIQHMETWLDTHRLPLGPNLTEELP